MSPSDHTYGPTCRLARGVTFSGSKEDGDVPPVKAQFFYASPLPIDDPLTPIPPQTGDSKNIKHPPRPFSAYDNNALEEAWLGLASEHDRKNHRKLRNSSQKPFTRSQAERRATIVSEIATKHNRKHSKEASAKSKGQTCSKCSNPVELCSCPHSRIGCTVCPPESSAVEAERSPESTQLAADREQRIEEEGLGNPYNPHCEDPHHVPLDSTVPVCCSELEKDVKAESQRFFTGILKRRESQVETEKLIQDVMSEAKKQRESLVDAKEELRPKKSHRRHGFGHAQGDATDEIESGRSMSRSKEYSTDSIPHTHDIVHDAVSNEHRSREHRAFEKHKHSREHHEFERHRDADLKLQAPNASAHESSHANFPANPDTGTTGFPFQRAPSRSGSPAPRSSSPAGQSASSTGTRRGASYEEDGYRNAAEDQTGWASGSISMAQNETPETIHVHRCKAHKNSRDHAEVPVGISRLHLVKLPDLQMKPIYWSPIHDIAAVTRATWFYKDSMYPVEPAVANQLEMGYRELRPWSRTWNDELNSAIEVGAVGEEKISHRLWPKDDSVEQTSLSTDPYCAARCFHGEVAAAGSVDPTKPDEKVPVTTELTKRFPNSHVIYRDANNAFILKPSLQPSEYYGRRPLAKIRKGITVGIHVVRGFDWKAWDRLHPSKKSASAIKAEQIAPVAGSADAGKTSACMACREQEVRPKVTDLILVIHGIGQKLSERVESFHFTHAINSFRRAVTVELGNDSVQKVLREDLGGVMVLPVNWRSNLSFEDGGPSKNSDKHTAENNSTEFSLKDITPETIPAVRNLISDVMLDIPYYLSHHRPKMIEALIIEANRVYRLWCRNNPEFHKHGRVHIIAHSLGSAMALDVLSKQPSFVQSLDPHSKKAQTKHFEFNTTNLFFAGSPAGFFLLLEKGKLMPRKGRNKPGAESSDFSGRDVVGEVGQFGCLAVDNLYNVLHYNDPIAYRLNATIDSLYAASLKNAQVPTAVTGWLETFSNAVRSIAPGAPNPQDLGVGQIVKPPAVRLPSQLEMEVHDFTREEIAERKFYLLNDNGQIDYFLSSGGGPLEIQYLNMLSAHSSYWSSPDFVRMLVIEVGRKPGRSHTLPNMKAVKHIHK